MQGKAQQELSDSRAAHTSLVQPQQISTAAAGGNASTSANNNSNNEATVGKKRPAAAGGGHGAAECPQVAPALRDAPLQVEQLR